MTYIDLIADQLRAADQHIRAAMDILDGTIPKTSISRLAELCEWLKDQADTKEAIKEMKRRIRGANAATIAALGSEGRKR